MTFEGIIERMQSDCDEAAEIGLPDPEFTVLRSGPGGVCVLSTEVDPRKTIATFHAFLNGN